MFHLFRNQNGMNIVGQGGKIILFMLPSLIAAILVQRYYPRFAALPEEVRVIQPLGYVLLVPGLILWASAVIQLLVEFPKGKLVISGAYAIVRNPIYASAAFFILPAISLITFTWGYVISSIFLYTGVMIFIGTEERQLTQAFGKVYEDYLASVDRLIPLKRHGTRSISSEAARLEQAKIPFDVKVVRLRYAIPLVLLVCAVYWFGIHPWMMNWGSTPAEQQMALPGDELHTHSTGHHTQAITINAPPEVIWMWLAQVGQDRAGFYTYTWLENLLGVDIHNTDEIRPEWQQIAAGDNAWRMMPANYLGGVGKDSTRRVLISEPGRVLALEMWGAYVIIPVDAPASSDAAISRLLVRSEAGPDNFVSKFLIDPMVFTMGKRMLLGLKARAEGLPDTPATTMAFAWLGWIAAGIVVAGRFLIHRQRWPWLAMPIAVMLPTILMGHDTQAGLVAFIATGIPILGFLTFGRRWWGPLLITVSVVMLTLLLAPEAFTAFGLFFALALLAGLTVIIASNLSGLPSTQQTEVVK